MTVGNFVLSLRDSYALARFLGLFTLSIDSRRLKFTHSPALSKYNRFCRWIVRILALTMFLAYCEILLGFSEWKDTARIQDRLLWFVNLAQGYLGVLLTYSNHGRRQSHLLRMLNSVLKCNRKLVRLLGRDVGTLKRFYICRKIRLVTVFFDILITSCQPIVFLLISHEWKSLVVLNKLVMLSTFLGQHQVQTFLGTAFFRMESYVRGKGADRLSAGDYRMLSEICTLLHKIRLSSNAYYGAFGLISYFSLIRTICFFYSCFSTLFTSGVMRPDLVSTLLIYFFWMMMPGLAVLIDFIYLGFMADLVDKVMKDFYLSVYRIEYKASVSSEIEAILQKEHVENMQTVITCGIVMNRQFSFEVVFEVLSWVVVAFVYNGGRYNSAALAFCIVNFNARACLFSFVLAMCFLTVLGYCIHKVYVYVTSAWNRILISYYGEEVK